VRAGSSVRDQWIGAGNSAGLAAARFALAHPSESVRGTLPGFGGNLGVVDTEVLLTGLGTATLIEHGYFKRHSACAYTHGPADASLLARDELASLDAEVSDITAITVETVAAGVALADTSWDSRHGAYFSVPFAVSSALTHGDVNQHRADPEHSKALLELASRVTVTDLSDFELPSPTHRPARVTVTVADGRQIVSEVAHPLGDADLSPFDYEEKAALLDDILADTHTATPDLSAELVLAVVLGLATAPRAGDQLARLRHPQL
jgi:2-methylcitrate dehydratase PrpD